MILIDTHCDSILHGLQTGRDIGKYSLQGHLDLPRAREAGVKIQFFALFPELRYKTQRALHLVLDLLAYYWRIEKNYKDELQTITSQKDLEVCLQSSKIGAIIAVEGGEVLEGNLNVLQVLYKLGIRSMGLTWNHRNELADGVAEEGTGGGLTRLGKEVVLEMNRLGMLVDVSHLAAKGFWDVLETSQKPVIASHSNCRALCNHPRNLQDRQIISLAEKGGVICLNFVPEFVGLSEADIEKFLNHIDHVCSLVGEDFVGLGSDFDGTSTLICGISDVRSYPKVIEGLKKRGYSLESIKKICGENCLRLLKNCLEK